MATTRSTEHRSPLKRFRELRRLTQYELSNKAGVCQPRISLIESGHVQPSPREKVALSRALEIPDTLLMGGES